MFQYTFNLLFNTTFKVFNNTKLLEFDIPTSQVTDNWLISIIVCEHETAEVTDNILCREEDPMLLVSDYEPYATDITDKLENIAQYYGTVTAFDNDGKFRTQVNNSQLVINLSLL